MPKLTRADVLLLFFVIMQALDGSLTYAAVWDHGVYIEGNPIVRWLMSVVGVPSGLFMSKLIATAGGYLLHVLECTRIIMGLSLFYLFAAVIPWTFMLLFYL